MFDGIGVIGYTALGFAVTYLGLETGWHFTTCNGRVKGVKPCLYAQIKKGMVAAVR